CGIAHRKAPNDVSGGILSAPRSTSGHRTGVRRAPGLDGVSVRVDPAHVVEDPGGHHRGAADLRVYTDHRQLRRIGGRRAAWTVLLDASGLSALFPEQHDRLVWRSGALG